MDNTGDLFKNLQKSIKSAKGLLYTSLTPDIQKKMSDDELAELSKMEKLTGPDLKRKAEELMRLNDKYNR